MLVLIYSSTIRVEIEPIQVNTKIKQKKHFFDNLTNVSKQYCNEKNKFNVPKTNRNKKKKITNEPFHCVTYVFLILFNVISLNVFYFSLSYFFLKCESIFFFCMKISSCPKNFFLRKVKNENNN